MGIIFCHKFIVEIEILFKMKELWKADTKYGDNKQFQKISYLNQKQKVWKRCLDSKNISWIEMGLIKHH